MIKYEGKYAFANVMTDLVDQETSSQIYRFLNHPAFEHSYIAIMPDCHAGAGAVIGTTMKMNNYVIPNVVGVDIGCGILAINLGEREINLEKLDQFIKNNIPSGFSHNGSPVLEIDELQFSKPLEAVANRIGEGLNKILCQISSLGSGNHFLEIDIDQNACKWLVVHTGSRNFGLQIAKYHQRVAESILKKYFAGADAYKDLEYLPIDTDEGKAYLNDMKVAQKFAQLNRRMIALRIQRHFLEMNDNKIDSLEEIESVHNYINFEDNILRKGAIQANLGQKVVIPFNMRDGVAIGTGKGSSKWNFSAPHGAGRIMSRTQARRTLMLEDFTLTMRGIYTTTANQGTIDESPMAYKDKDMLLEAIKETVEVYFLMKPIYNFKNSDLD